MQFEINKLFKGNKINFSHPKQNILHNKTHKIKKPFQKGMLIF